MPTLPQMIREYIWTVGAYWWVIVPGVLMPLRDVFNILERLGKTPRWVELAVVFVCLSIAQFLAYRNTVTNLYAVIEEKRQFSMKINTLESENGSLHAENERLTRQINQLVLPESVDSLRRRTERVADELYEYLEKRGANQPPFAGPNSNDPNPSDETKKAIQIYRAYSQETENYYMRHFKDRVVGIIREYQLKGVPVRYLENDFSRTGLLPYVAAVGSVGEGADDLSQFRELAFHVDAQNNLINIPY